MKRKQLRVGIIGCGSIGSILVKSIKAGKAGNAVVAAVYDSNSAALEKFSSEKGVPAAKNMESLVSACDLVVECASQAAVREYAPVITAKKDLMVLSVGALLDEQLRSLLVSNAMEHGRRIYVPSGAACGLDGLKGARTGALESVKLTTTKSPKSLGLDVKERTIVFSGAPEEAVKKFPANINVSAAVKLATGGAKVTVEIVADPGMSVNQHEVSAKGEFGELNARTRNVPSKDNPKTSALAAMSAVAMIREMTETLVVGT